MKVDLTLLVTPALVKDAQNNEKKAFTGHLGTHFDVMNKTFPLDYTERKGIVFDVNHIKDRDIEISDIALEQAEKDMFVAFHTGFIEETREGIVGGRDDDGHVLRGAAAARRVAILVPSRIIGQQVVHRHAVGSRSAGVHANVMA